MANNIAGMAATGTYSDAFTQDLTAQVTWTVSDTSIITIGANTGAITIAGAGLIYGGIVGVTATLAPGTPGTSSLIVVPSDSGTVAPRMPMLDAHWQALGLSPWGGWWGCQESSGYLVGSGSAGFTLQAGGMSTLTYRDAVAGWTRRGLTSQSGSVNGAGWSASASIGPNIQTTSTALLGYIKNKTVAGTINVFGWVRDGSVTTAQFCIQQKANGIPTVNVSGSATNFTTSHDDGRVHPFLLVLDRTNSRAKAYSDLDKVTGTFPATAFYDQTKGYGGVGGFASPSGTLVYMAYCTGSVAEALSDNGRASAFLKALGWSVGW